MIAYLRGDVAALNENSVILEVNNIGYLVYVSGRDADRLAGAKKEVCVHTYMHVKKMLYSCTVFVPRMILKYLNCFLA